MGRRRGIIAAGVLVFAFVLTQILVPGIGERKIENRLTEGGGSADVTLGAFPAARLLFSDGERIEVDAHDLNLDLGQQEGVFDRLDGFSVVDVSIDDFHAGPFQLDSFRLSRDGDGPYRITSSGTTSPTALADYGFERLQLPGENLIDALLAPLLDNADAPVPVELDMQLTSDGGRIQVLSGGGTLAGFPTGPLAELLTSAIVVQL